ncbi:MAG: hypothetical protein IT577_23420 [Verrucomicrobiae bacterium]|nr:hypothetical protein [Verrucomicrobiae bacterium]
MVEYWINFVFLAFFLVAFAWYRRLILAEYNLHYLGYWAPLIEAAVLAKVIMVGDVLRIGRRFRDWPLIVTTIYRAAAFGALAGLFAVLEHVAEAMLHGKPAAAGIEEIARLGWDVLLARGILILAAFLPFFTLKEIERVFGAERVRGMFIRSRAEESSTAADAGEKSIPKP